MGEQTILCGMLQTGEPGRSQPQEPPQISRATPNRTGRPVRRRCHETVERSCRQCGQSVELTSQPAACHEKSTGRKTGSRSGRLLWSSPAGWCRTRARERLRDHRLPWPMRPHAYRLLTACLPPAYRLLTACSPPAYRLLTACSPPAYRLLTACSPPAYRLLTAGPAHTRCDPNEQVRCSASTRWLRKASSPATPPN